MVSALSSSRQQSKWFRVARSLHLVAANTECCRHFACQSPCPIGSYVLGTVLGHPCGIACRALSAAVSLHIVIPSRRTVAENSLLQDAGPPAVQVEPDPSVAVSFWNLPECCGVSMRPLHDCSRLFLCSVAFAACMTVRTTLPGSESGVWHTFVYRLTLRTPHALEGLRDANAPFCRKLRTQLCKLLSRSHKPSSQCP